MDADGASGPDLAALLRFLTQDAKIPLSNAIATAKALQNAQLTRTDVLAKTPFAKIQEIFPDEKQAKSVHSAAKRISKKRQAGEPTKTESAIKRSKGGHRPGDPISPATFEHELALPETDASEEDLCKIVLISNRAPLMLAFVVVLLKYTMPEQPLSARLSLAQAVVSVNSHSKAVSIGLAEKGTSADDQGWGQGQPSVKIMTREIKVMRRHGYDWKTGDEQVKATAGALDKREAIKVEASDEGQDEQQYTKSPTHAIEETSTMNQQKHLPPSEPALWGLDLEALRSSKTPIATNVHAVDGAALPVYKAQSARNYLLNSFSQLPASDSEKSKEGRVDSKRSVGSKPHSSSPKKSLSSSRQADKSRHLACLLRAIDMLHNSWSSTLSKQDLDRRAWSWYVSVRPDVQPGASGWGNKGEISLSKILALRRQP